VTARTRVVAFVACVIVMAGAASAYAVHDRGRYEAVHSRPPSVPSATAPVTGPRIVFRHTGLDNRYGLVAMVPLSDPGGPRTFTDLACDRVYATATDESCLQVKRGVTTKYDLLQLDRNWNVVEQNSLPGIPSRTRLSPDGTLVADTTFVSGHSYMQIGFSTATEIRHFDGTSYGNLEQFTLVINGKTVDPVDRNIWGVTFASDDNTFYATVGTGGKTYLVKGSLADRTLTSIHENAECPSLSPDGTHVAYKVNVGHGSTTFWTPAVLDLRTGVQTLLTGETRNIDDQVEWLDGHTLLYGVPRTDQAGVEDVWSIHTDATATPHLLIKDAWSPAVVR
jgi:hypothetical protein